MPAPTLSRACGPSAARKPRLPGLSFGREVFEVFTPGPPVFDYAEAGHPAFAYGWQLKVPTKIDTSYTIQTSPISHQWQFKSPMRSILFKADLIAALYYTVVT